MSEFCKISVDGAIPKGKLASHIAESTGGELDDAAASITTKWATIDVVRNSDYDSSRISEWPDGFLFFAYLVEIHIEPRADVGTYRRNVGTLLDALWDRGLRAVAACDFEEQLPMQGGYRTRRW